jgi:CRISPR/Cas system endoribonuclease Cas6 (RAMP superfamily)
MTAPHCQQGYTLISLIFMLGLLGFFILLLMTVGPIYLDHSKVKNALTAIEQDKDQESKSEAEIKSSLDKRFNMNYVSDLKAQDVKVIKRGGYLKIEAKYEVVKKIAGNLSVLVEFDDVVEVGKE